MASKVSPPSPERLGDATDRLNSALLEAEDALCELSLGVAASVPLGADRELHFRKRGNDWGLIITRNEDSSETEVRSASRKARLEVASKLPALRDALLEAYETQLVHVEGSIDAVRAFTASLRGLHRPQ